MSNYYETISLEEYEWTLANREYWDRASCEWNNSKMEQKLIRLGIFVKRGGDLNRVIALYAEDREYTYRIFIQHSIRQYVETLVEKRITDITLRLYKLEKEEAVKLLSEMLKVSVEKSFAYDYKKQSYDIDKINTKNLDAEGILASIEEEHRQTHPDETIEEVEERVHIWISDSWW